MQAGAVHEEMPLGLFEVNSDGTVVYYNRDGAGAEVPDMAGRNFFRDVAPVARSEEFQKLIRGFERGAARSHSFDYRFETGGASLPVRVMLSRVRERLHDSESDSVLILIRKVRAAE
jgi:photoactive yellow protein